MSILSVKQEGTMFRDKSLKRDCKGLLGQIDTVLVLFNSSIILLIERESKDLVEAFSCANFISYKSVNVQQLGAG